MLVHGRSWRHGVPGRNHALIGPLSRSSSTAGTSMAINLTRGDTRPILIGLAIAAVLGWGLFIYAELHGAAQNQKARQQIRQITSSEESFKTQLAQQQQASGSLADLQTRIAAATDQSRQATATRDQAQAELASGQKELEGPCCTDQGSGRTDPSPVWGQVMRT